MPAAALLLCAGLLVASPDRAGYQAAAARAGRDAGAHVKLAVWCEAHDMDAERLDQVAAALAIDPRNAAARAMLGLVRYGERWLSPDGVAQAAESDAAMAAKRAEYEAKRQATPETADGQWQLGLWCEQNGLKPEAIAHFTAVTQLSPRRTEAWRKLGCELYRGRWRNPEQIAAERAEDEAQKQADQQWQPLIEKWKKDLVFDGPRLEQARSALRAISDPRAVPAIQRALGHGNRVQQELAVELLSRIDCPASSHALAAMSLSDRWPEVPPFAIRELKRRDPRDYMGAMIGLMRHPVKYYLNPIPPRCTAGMLVILGEHTRTERIYEVQRGGFTDSAAYGPPPSGMSGMTFSFSTASPEDMRRFLLASPAEQFREIARLNPQILGPQGGGQVTGDPFIERDMRAIDQFNARLEQANQRIDSILCQITGESFGGDRDQWLEWWTDKIGLRYQRPQPQPKRTATRYVVLPSFVHTVCLGAGTPVVTLTSPRPIESLQVGDIVLSQDTTTGILSYEPVVGVHRNPPSETLRLRLKGETLVSSPIHRFWRPGRGWALARDLTAGESIRTVNGRAALLSIEPGAVQPVFNLDVARNHSFFVGSQMALVCDNSLPPAISTPFDAEPTLESIAQARAAPRAPGKLGQAPVSTHKPSGILSVLVAK